MVFSHSNDFSPMNRSEATEEIPFSEMEVVKVNLVQKSVIFTEELFDRITQKDQEFHEKERSLFFAMKNCNISFSCFGCGKGQMRPRHVTTSGQLKNLQFACQVKNCNKHCNFESWINDFSKQSDFPIKWFGGKYTAFRRAYIDRVKQISAIILLTAISKAEAETLVDVDLKTLKAAIVERDNEAPLKSFLYPQTSGKRKRCSSPDSGSDDVQDNQEELHQTIMKLRAQLEALKKQIYPPEALSLGSNKIMTNFYQTDTHPLPPPPLILNRQLSPPLQIPLSPQEFLSLKGPHPSRLLFVLSQHLSLFLKKLLSLLSLQLNLSRKIPHLLYPLPLQLYLSPQNPLSPKEI